MRKKFLLLVCAAGFFLGCGAPFRCFEERIEVSWPATITRGAEQESATLAGVVAPGNVGESVFAELKSVLVNEASAQTFGLVWSVPAFNTNGGGIAVALAAPLQRGEVLQITSSFQGGGWGRFSLPNGERAQVSVRAENFVATSASGTMQVLQVAPLVLRLEITATDTSNATIQIRGDASFRFVREQAPCT
ncbi:hypothetical protein HUU05_04520 [candidate division KSB1 bacterium]|nr:hypothetical protein [candidate division KSB1 bacterium]